MSNLDSLIDIIPKAELHVHLFGTLTPELFFKIAKRNNIKIPFKNEAQLSKSFVFKDLPSFIEMYDLGTSVFRTERDFYDITFEYLQRSYSQNVKYVELIFDPQSHYPFKVSSDTAYMGISKACYDAEKEFGIKSNLILTFVRHLDLDSAWKAFDEITQYPRIVGVGIGGIEKPFPPRLFSDIYKEAKFEKFLKTTAHCGEDADWTYIQEGLDELKLDRVDHGINCEQNPMLMEYLRIHQIPMTICPISNVKIGLFQDLSHHNVKRLLDYGLNVSLHSDDPSYFNSYINDVYKATTKALDLSREDIIKLAKNSFKGAFCTPEEKLRYYEDIIDVISRLKD
jgi:adenosine deaminase